MIAALCHKQVERPCFGSPAGCSVLIDAVVGSGRQGYRHVGGKLLGKMSRWENNFLYSVSGKRRNNHSFISTQK